MAKKQSAPVSKPISRRMQRRAEQRRKKRQTQLIILAAVILLILGLSWAVWDNNRAQQMEVASGLPAEISVTEAYEMYQAGAFLLDVRDQEEWDEFHIPGTTLIPLEELESRLDEVPRDQDIVVVCRSGNQSCDGRDILQAAGLERVTSMDGGLSDWRDAGYPIE